MKLFSEYVAADAEASEPVIKKEKPKEVRGDLMIGESSKLGSALPAGSEKLRNRLSSTGDP